MKKEKLNLAQWGQIQYEVTVNRCPKCDSFMEHVPALGIVSLSVCKKCKKFYGLVIEDVTAKLTKQFKKNILTPSHD